jgi:hypothetical protein
MTHRHTPHSWQEAKSDVIDPVIGKGLGISLPVIDPIFTARSVHIARQVKSRGIEGIEIRIPDTTASSGAKKPKRAPALRLLAPNILRDACRDFPKEYRTPVSVMIEQILEDVPELGAPLPITYGTVIAPVDRKTNERFIMLVPNEDGTEKLTDIRESVYASILHASGVILRPNNRPLDLTVAYAQDYVDPRLSTRIANAYRDNLPLEIVHGPADFNPDPR